MRVANVASRCHRHVDKAERSKSTQLSSLLYPSVKSRKTQSSQWEENRGNSPESDMRTLTDGSHDQQAVTCHRTTDGHSARWRCGTVSRPGRGHLFRFRRLLMSALSTRWRDGSCSDSRSPSTFYIPSQRECLLMLLAV